MHGNPGLARISAAAEADARSAYERHIEERVRNLARRHQLPETRVRVVGGDVAGVLPEFAKSERANLVVMGAVSRSFVERVLIGHTSERLLDQLDCDVLVVKSPGFHTRVSHRSTHRGPGIGVEVRAAW